MKKELYVAKSNIEGKGVFSKRKFKRGEVVFILKGSIKKLHIKSSKDSKLGPKWVGISKGTWIDPNGIAEYLNHSCNPNLGIRGRVLFVALRDIQADEELTFDYSITEDDHFWQFKCNCGQKGCRKVLRSIQFLPESVFKSYLPYVPSYFQKVYNRANRLRVRNG